MELKEGHKVHVRGTKVTGVVKSRIVEREKVAPYYLIPVVTVILDNGGTMEYNEAELKIDGCVKGSPADDGTLS